MLSALILFSLLTPPEDELRTNSFFARLQSPSDASDSMTVESDLPGTSVTAAEAGQQLLLVNLLRLRQGAAGRGFWKAYRVDLAGLAFGWMITVGLVLLTWLFFWL